MREQILIIHPDLDTLLRLRMLLASAGYDILTAMDKKTARDISRELNVSLVICEPALLQLADQQQRD